MALPKKPTKDQHEISLCHYFPYFHSGGPGAGWYPCGRAIRLARKYPQCFTCSPAKRTFCADAAGNSDLPAPLWRGGVSHHRARFPNPDPAPDNRTLYPDVPAPNGDLYADIRNGKANRDRDRHDHADDDPDNRSYDNGYPDNRDNRNTHNDIFTTTNRHCHPDGRAGYRYDNGYVTGDRSPDNPADDAVLYPDIPDPGDDRTVGNTDGKRNCESNNGDTDRRPDRTTVS